jgi:GT2 family glycosyltransferase
MRVNARKGVTDVNTTSIIILTRDNLSYNKLCIESIRRFTPAGEYEIIVVDNGSTDGTVEWLAGQSDIKAVINPQNLGFPKGCNQGIGVAERGNDILLLNNDTIVTQGWLENLQRGLYSGSDIGAVGPVTNKCSNLQAIRTEFSGFPEMFDFAQRYNAALHPVYSYRQKLVGFCLLIKREVVDAVGDLDERFTPGNYEDDDYSYRIQQAGYKLLLCQSTFIYHFGSRSFKEDINAYRQNLATNAKRFADKWGFDQSYSSLIRNDVIGLIDQPTEAPIRVLEVGCACGATLLEIQNRFKSAKLYGIELNSAAVEIASYYFSARSGDIESMELDFDAGFFDYIIFGDVLEHLHDPWKVLARMRGYLRSGGSILASIPNVMNYTVIAGLLAGNFTYVSAGLLDRTHLRFFTLNEIVRMFHQAGYGDLAVLSKTISANGSDGALVDKLVDIAGADKRQQLLTYQYLVRAPVETPRAQAGAESLLATA